MPSDFTSMELQLPSQALGLVSLVARLKSLRGYVHVELSCSSTKTRLVFKEFKLPKKDYEVSIPSLLHAFRMENPILPNAVERRLPGLLIELYRCAASNEESGN
jgi:hypothetical protein